MGNHPRLEQRARLTERNNWTGSIVPKDVRALAKRTKDVFTYFDYGNGLCGVSNCPFLYPNNIIL